jgi:argininosuccinate lyase
MKKKMNSAKSAKRAKKLWAGRFAEKTAWIVEAFTESVSFDRRLWKHDIMGSIAHARMLGRQGIIPKKDAELIVKALKEIASDIEAGRFCFREELEDVHMNIEAELIRRTGPAGARLHTARSRNDQVALDMRLYLRDETREIEILIDRLRTALADAAERHINVTMPGYTHLQRAQPVLLAHHLLAYVEMLGRDSGRFADALKRINILPLGACALAGTSLPIDRGFVAKELGFDGVSANSIDSVSDRDFVIEFMSACALLAMHLSRLAEEIVLWSTGEFSFIELPDAFATGSSIMPQKKNPDVAELARGKTGRVYGNLMGMLSIMKALPLSYNRDMQEDKPLLFDTVDAVKASLAVFSEMLPVIMFKRERLSAVAAEGFSTATDMAEYLVRKGLPFREAHETTGRVVRYAIEKGKDLHSLALDELKRFSPLFGGDVFPVLDARASVEAKKSYGGTASSEVRMQLQRLRKAASKRKK